MRGPGRQGISKLKKKRHHPLSKPSPKNIMKDIRGIKGSITFLHSFCESKGLFYLWSTGGVKEREIATGGRSFLTGGV